MNHAQSHHLVDINKDRVFTCYLCPLLFVFDYQAQRSQQYHLHFMNHFRTKMLCASGYGTHAINVKVKPSAENANRADIS